MHACFVYLVEDDRLVLAAASEPYAELVGEIALEQGEGLAWWAAEHKEPAWIREELLEDPRVKYVPELEEERFQSLVSVPIVGKDGNVIGVISSHTEAPREFTEAEVEVLVSSASLVAGAIENARLYEEMRRRVDELEHLTELAEILAGAETLDTVLPRVASRARKLLRADASHLYLLDPATEVLHLRASAPEGAEARAEIGLSELGPELARSGRSASVAVPLVANDELLGLLAAGGTSEVDLARAVANQTAVALKKIELIETSHREEPDQGLLRAAGPRRSDPGPRRARGSARLRPRSALRRPRRLPSLRRARARPRGRCSRLTLRPSRRFDAGAPARAARRARSACWRTSAGSRRSLEAPASIGLSNVCRGAASFAAGFEEARDALLGTTVLQGTPGVMAYEELGPYKYLLRMPFDGGVRDAHRDAVARIAEYDRQRSTALLKTLEEFLRRRGSISATAEALYVHPNTLRQRLRRIGELSGLDLRKDDWLMVEIAVKMVRLQEALGTAQMHTQRPDRL